MLHPFDIYLDTFTTSIYSHGLTTFGDLRPGTIFHLYDETAKRPIPFMKIESGYNEFNMDINAICLFTGQMLDFENDVEVRRD